jgi:hypothetical protein
MSFDNLKVIDIGFVMLTIILAINVTQFKPTYNNDWI